MNSQAAYCAVICIYLFIIHKKVIFINLPIQISGRVMYDVGFAFVCNRENFGLERGEIL